MLMKTLMFLYSPADDGGLAATSDDKDVEFVVDTGQQVEVEPEVIEKPASTVSNEEFEALRKRADSTELLARSVEQMASTMRPAPANVTQQGQVESDEEFARRIEEEAYKPGGFAKSVQEAAQRQIQPLRQQFSSALLDTKKDLLRVDPALGEKYKRFEKEVEDRVQAIPRQYWHPDIHRQVLKDVLTEKSNVLVQEEAQKLFEQKMAAVGLDADGKPISGSKQDEKQIAVTSISSGSGSPKPQSSARQQLKITPQDVRAMVNQGLIRDEKDLNNPEYKNSVESWIRVKKGR
jgi:hypothetical protein